MSDELPEDLRALIQDESAKWQDKWQSWQSSLYNSLLTSNTLLVAVCPIIFDNQSNWSRLAVGTICSAALVSSVLVVTIMMQACTLYNELGFGPEVSTTTDVYSEIRRQSNSLQVWTRRGRMRKQMDIAAKCFTFCGLVALALYAVFRPVS